MATVSSLKPIQIQVTEIIAHFLHTVQQGYLILTVQDGCVVKAERTEKFIISARERDLWQSVLSRPTQKHPFLEKILTELRSIRYGLLVVRLEDGQVNQIEKTEKRRINEMQGTYGDGI
ncbi:MAG TPA: YezD family protein [Patescibacteria group bacterium]|nr:YezD family protein [Patescibacteria group bacterium]